MFVKVRAALLDSVAAANTAAADHLYTAVFMSHFSDTKRAAVLQHSHINYSCCYYYHIDIHPSASTVLVQSLECCHYFAAAAAAVLRFSGSFLSINSNSYSRSSTDTSVLTCNTANKSQVANYKILADKHIGPAAAAVCINKLSDTIYVAI
eukprot:11673-Heterococcus_DN1.PRE.1